MPSSKVQVTGLNTIMRNLQMHGTRIEQAVKRAQEAEGSSIMDDSQAMCPIDTGELVESRYVAPQGETVEIGYGKDYALIVHEREVKYLQRPVEQAQGGYAKRLAERAKRNESGTHHPKRPKGNPR